MAAINFPDTPTVGQQLTVGDVTWEWTGTVWEGLVTISVGPAGADGADFQASTTPPEDTEAFPLWYNTEEGKAYIYYDNFWVELTPSIAGPQGEAGTNGTNGEAGRFTVSETAPASPVAGDGWFNSVTAKLFVYYDSFWVEATGNLVGPEGPQGPAVTSMNASAVVTTVSDKADNYTVLTSDKNSLIRVTAATDKTITIGTDTAFQIGDRIDILQDGAGVVTVAVTGDATLAGRGSSDTSYTIGQQFDAVSVVCVDTNAYRVIGNANAV